MKIKSVFVAAAVVVSVLAAQQKVEARGLRKSDHVLMKKAMVFVTQLAVIFEKNIDKPDTLLVKLERFIKVRGPKMRALAAKVDKLKNQLDPAAQKELQKKYAKHPAIARMQKAMMKLMMKYQQDKQFQQKLMALVMKLQAKAKKKKQKTKRAR
jgi:hypothetical protein